MSHSNIPSAPASAPNAAHQVVPTVPSVPHHNVGQGSYHEYVDEQVHISPMRIFFGFLRERACKCSGGGSDFNHVLLAMIFAALQIFSLILADPYFMFFLFIFCTFAQVRYSVTGFSKVEDGSAKILCVFLAIWDWMWTFYWFNLFWIFVSNNTLSFLKSIGKGTVCTGSCTSLFGDFDWTKMTIWGLLLGLLYFLILWTSYIPMAIGSIFCVNGIALWYSIWFIRDYYKAGKAQRNGFFFTLALFCFLSQISIVICIFHIIVKDTHVQYQLGLATIAFCVFFIVVTFKLIKKVRSGDLKLNNWQWAAMIQAWCCALWHLYNGFFYFGLIFNEVAIFFGFDFKSYPNWSYHSSIAFSNLVDFLLFLFAIAIVWGILKSISMSIKKCSDSYSEYASELRQQHSKKKKTHS
ncbi:hypothetical protein PCE1_000836 [Barthelona sp. PCE]